MNVSNKTSVCRLGFKTMRTAKGRNVIAVIAIMLTALLFTAMFTIIGSIAYGTEQSNFRQVGTCSHGCFKRLEYSQCRILAQDKGVEEYGLRRVAGIASGEEFLKHTAEVSWCSDTTADWMYLRPTAGRLPQTADELATDSKVLALLGASGEIGEEITLTIDVDGTEVIETYTLCGIWDYDAVFPVSHILLSEKGADNLLSQWRGEYRDENIGTYSMDVMLSDDRDITSDLLAILERSGFQSDNTIADNYIAIGVNWGYFSESGALELDFGTSVAIAVLLAIIMATGYLVIFNVFSISVANDIRHYGLLKTIGTTARQIRRIVMIQALTLSALGIPIGLAAGWLVGAVLTPVVMNELSVYNAGASANPIIFLFSAAFALLTVVISCLKPAGIAARVSPIEAVRYTEGSGKFGIRKSERGVSIFGMAMANLGRSKGKTALTVTSLALSIMLFSLVCTFANSFSMDKYLSNITNDFVVSCPSYFNTGATWEPDDAITAADISVITSLDGVERSYTTYGADISDNPEALYNEQQFYNNVTRFGDIDDEEFALIKENSSTEEGLYISATQVLGLEQSAFADIIVVEGELDSLTKDGYIAVEDSGNFSAGDKLTLIYTDSMTFINNRTGETTTDIQEAYDSGWIDISVERETHEKDYTICAVVDLTRVNGYGYSTNADLFVMECGQYLSSVKNAAPLYTAINVTDGQEAAAEKAISDYTEYAMLDYTSKATIAQEFASFKRMFFILGTSLSVVVGLVGLLNFTNTILTGIFARRRELSVLRSIGMTGTQLKQMLIYESLFYTATAVIAGLALNIITIPASSAMESIFWFCDYRFSALPLLISVPMLLLAGIALPLVTYGVFAKKTVVERLRESE